jgi:hypothetical protein
MDLVSRRSEPARNQSGIIADTPTVGRVFTSNDGPSQLTQVKITSGRQEIRANTIPITPPTVEGGLPGPVRSSWSSRNV